MPKHILAYGMLAFSIVFATGCASTPAPTEPSVDISSATFIAEGGNTTIAGDLPEGWTREDDRVTTPIAAIFAPLENEEDLFQDNVNISHDDLTGYSTSFQEYLDVSLEIIAERIPDVTYIVNEPVTIGGVDAQRIQYTEPGPQGLTFMFEQYLFVAGDDGFAITYSALDDSFETFHPDVEAFVESLAVVQN